MYRPHYTPLSEPNHQQKPLPNCFKLLCWNLQKTDFSHFMHRTIEQLLDIAPPQLLALQEASTHESQTRFFDLPFAMAPNIQTGKRHFGVLTACEYSMTPYLQCLTHSRELGWSTHKTALITQHQLANGEILIHANIHAINFVPNPVFQRELQHLYQHLAQHTGPLIVSGDFNTWNKTRLKTLHNLNENLQLQQAEIANANAIKTLFRHPLDYIFFRQLKLQEARALHVREISDHNPLLARFCTL
ncbi:MAG: endonuclease/exonuclease/phosphatase family protein [Gammaproteobacteria bacterium]|nr:endonuclease/exonuclease/phosphatase family protein [Gammaproteobacteria bacterium]MBD3776260.1 endonuclease/exonuclease/phosphatase family protein [Thiotrichales bacterium]